MTLQAATELNADQINFADFSDSVADVLEQGWIQKAFSVNNENRYCARGAIDKVLSLDQHNFNKELLQQWSDLFDAWLKSSPHFDFMNVDRKGLCSTIVDWNDHELQTKENVVSAFRNFANYLRRSE